MGKRKKAILYFWGGIVSFAGFSIILIINQFMPGIVGCLLLTGICFARWLSIRRATKCSECGKAYAFEEVKEIFFKPRFWYLEQKGVRFQQCSRCRRQINRWPIKRKLYD